MLDREKVIKGLTGCVTAGLEKACPADCPYFLQCFPDVGPATPFVLLMQDALDLLKEQEPVAPSVGSSNEPDGLGSWWYQCGKCKMPIDYGDRFCRRCGHEVKWNELEK